MFTYLAQTANDNDADLNVGGVMWILIIILIILLIVFLIQRIR